MQDSADKVWAGRLSGWFRDLRVAAILLTRLPVRHDAHISTADLSRSVRAFPIIGIGVGLAGAAVFTAASLLGLGPWLAALAAVGATILATGALHEDGLADVADGFGGGNDPGAKLAIMSDSRIGSYGALALILGTAARVMALAILAGSGDAGAAGAALVAAHTVARGALPAIMARDIAVRPGGLAAAAGTPPASSVLAATAIAAVVAVVALGTAAGLLALAFAVAVFWLIAGLARRQIGGYTGDVLGALEQSVEIVVLIAAVIAR